MNLRDGDRISKEQVANAVGVVAGLGALLVTLASTFPGLAEVVAPFQKLLVDIGSQPQIVAALLLTWQGLRSTFARMNRGDVKIEIVQVDEEPE